MPRKKLAILSRIAFCCAGTGSDVFCEGIEEIESSDIDYARQLGYVIKLLAIAKRSGESVEMRVHPAMVPADSLLANINDEFNAIEVVGSAVGNQVFYGKGAGQMPTASAVVSDMVAVVERKADGASPAVGDMVLGQEALPVAPVEQIQMRYFLRMQVCDLPGVLEHIARILAGRRLALPRCYRKNGT